MVFAWVERWLAQRRTREIMRDFIRSADAELPVDWTAGAAFRHHSRPEVERYIAILKPIQAVLPPGLAADAITQGIYPQWGVALSSFSLLCASG